VMRDAERRWETLRDVERHSWCHWSLTFFFCFGFQLVYSPSCVNFFLFTVDSSIVYGML
jgi:hypothetical protein